jgi:hypothetical protein
MSSIATPADYPPADVVIKCLSLPLLQIALLQMHGTGTSLGDPIEVGAVAAVFSHRASTSTSHTALITSKSGLGHAEPAAGIVGVLHSLNAVQQGALPSLLHLHTLNPFISSALGSRCSDGLFFLPRQLAPRAVCGDQGQSLVSGVSSFAFQVSDVPRYLQHALWLTNTHAMLSCLITHCAKVFLYLTLLSRHGFATASGVLARLLCHDFGVITHWLMPYVCWYYVHPQGTNAHLVVSTPASSPASMTARSAAAHNSTSWQQSRHWFMGPVSPLLAKVLSTTVATAGLRLATTAVHMQARLAATDHGVLLGNSCSMLQDAVLLPAAAALMMAAAAADSCSAISAAEAAPQIVLAESVFGQLLWPAAAAAALELNITVLVKEGILDIVSAGSTTAGVLTSRLIRHTSAHSTSGISSTSSSSTPRFLAALICTAQQQYNQLPGPVAKAQAASARRSAVLESTVEAVCQLEASFMLPFFTNSADGSGSALAQLPAALASCVLNPRGFGADGVLDVVDPDAPEDADAPAPAARTSTFWLSSSTSGVAMQLTGMAYRPLPAALQLAAAAAQVQAMAPAQHIAADMPTLGPSAAAGRVSAGADAVVLAGGSVQARGMVFRPLSQPLPGVAAQDQPQAATAVVSGDSENTLEHTFSTEWVAVTTACLEEASSSTLQVAASGAVDAAAATAAAASLLQVVSQPQLTIVQGLQLNTQGAFAATTLRSPCGCTCAAANTAPWALFRAANLERTGLTLSAVDSSAFASGRASHALTFGVLPLAAAAAGAGAQQLSVYGSCIAAGVMYEARLVRQPVAAAAAALQPAAGVLSALPAAARHGTYIVTGGTGAVGALVGRWLVLQLQVQHVHFVSRSGSLPDSLADLLLASNSSRDEVTLITASKADVGAAEDAACVAGTAQQRLPVLGIMHAAGVLADGLLQNQTLASIRQVMSPKSSAYHQLHKHLQHQPISHQVLFSSVASLLGSPGQTNYAVANAGLDAAAQSAQSCGMPCVSVQFGAWANTGMAGRDAQTAARAARLGLALLKPGQALSALALSLRYVQQQQTAVMPAVLAAVPICWGAFLAHVTQPPSGFFAEFLAAAESGPAGAARAASAVSPSAAAAAAVAGTVTVAAAASAAGAAATEQQVSEAVGDAISSILGAVVDPDEPLMAAGLDSLGAVELRNMLQDSLAVQLPNTVRSTLSWPPTSSGSPGLFDCS